jgi:hypothetical protein
MKNLLMLLLLAMPATAQDLPQIESDRPYRTTPASVIPVGSIQVEVGLEAEKDFNEMYSLPATLLRWSPVEGLEARAIVDYMVPEIHDWKGSVLLPDGTHVLNVPRRGFTYGLGTKVHLTQGSGVAPKIALVADLVRDFYRKTFLPDIRLSMAHQLPAGISLGYNLGGRIERWTEEWMGIYTLSVTCAASSSVGIYGELFGGYHYTEREYLELSYDVGMMWRVRDNFQLDLSIGSGISSHTADLLPADLLLGIGGAYRVRW